MRKARARRRPTTVGVMHPRWRSRHGYRTMSLRFTMRSRQSNRTMAVAEPPGLQDPRWRSRQGYITTRLIKTMDGAAGGAVMHGLVSRIGALTLGGSVGAIALGGRSGALAMSGRAGPVARPGPVARYWTSLSEVFFWTTWFLKLDIIHGGGAGRAPW